MQVTLLRLSHQISSDEACVTGGLKVLGLVKLICVLDVTLPTLSGYRARHGPWVPWVLSFHNFWPPC